MTNSNESSKTVPSKMMSQTSWHQLPVNVWLSVLSIRRPVTTVMVMLSLFITGIVASRLLPQESWPTLSVPVVFIQVPYSGATPDEVERLITRPLEEALATLSGVTEMHSRSRADSAGIRLNMKLNTDLDSKILEVREKVDMVRHLLPDDVRRVFVQKFSTDDMPVASLTLSSEQDLAYAYDLLNRNLKQPLERLIGVGKVEFRGVVEPQIQIQLDGTRMAMNRVNQDALVRDLRASNFLIRSGVITDGGRRYRVSPQGEYKSLQDIRDFQVKAGVKLSDVAVVSLVTPERNSQIRTDRKPSVGVEIFKESDANVVKVTDNIVELVNEISASKDLPGVKIEIRENAGEEIQESLADLLVAGAMGIVMSFIVLFFFLRNVQITFIVVAAVPISLSFAVAGMYFMGYTLNMLTLAGLFIAVGLLIDNSVVICESILQQKDTDMDLSSKILNGVNKVSIAIITGTLTTTIVFLPLLVGEANFLTLLIEQIAVAICLPLFASLIIAKTAIPLLLSRVNESAISSVVMEGRMTVWYRNALRYMLTHTKKTFLLIFALILSAVFAKQAINGYQDHERAERELYIRYHIQGDHKMEEVAKAVDQMEAYLYQHQDEFMFTQVNSRIWSGYAYSSLKLKEDIDIPIHELKDKIREGFPPMAIARPSFEWSESKGKVVRISLNGSSTEKLNELSETIIPILADIPEFAEVGVDDESTRRELLLRIDSTKVSRLNKSTSEVASRIATALRGANLRSFRDPNLGEVDIRLVYHGSESVPLAEIKDLPILEHQGRIITLQQLVTFDSEPVARQITRINRRTSMMININLNDINRMEAAEKIGHVLKAVDFPPGYDWSLGRQFQNDDEAFKDMGTNMMLALALIFMVMAALFESLLMPIAILSSIGLAFIGVYWTFAIMGMGLSSTAMIGMLILMGIVVNNGIVLIDQINQLKGRADDILVPIVEACVSRIRPIFMTVATTIMGMLPLAFASTSNEAYPMSVAIIGGLLFSTFTSLFLVPFGYLVLLKLGERTVAKFRRANAYASKRFS
ncbi:efflux RND transporter permease subunit [Thalassotalea fusca]